MLEIKRRLHVDQDYILEKTRKHGEYKYTADDYWTARIGNHKIMLLPLHCQYWYDQRNLTSYCKITWEFYFAKNKKAYLLDGMINSYQSHMHVDIFENLTHMLLVLHWALSNYLWPLWDLFHAFKIKITNTPHILVPTSTLEVAQKYAFHPHKNTLIILTWLFILQKEYGLCGRKRKSIRAQKHRKRKKKKEKK